MSRKANVYFNGVLAGSIEKFETGKYRFQYDKAYLGNSELAAVSLSFPKREKPFLSAFLFPFFFGLLSEGTNKQNQCRFLKIDENDHFSLLLKTAEADTIGAITVKETLP
jgi:HipA-like protein